MSKSIIKYGQSFEVTAEPSEILIEQGLSRSIPEKLDKTSEYAIITDSNLISSHAQVLYDKMVKIGLSVTSPIEIPAGEDSKSFIQAENIANELSERGYGKNTTLIALGGGMIGDLVGFVAANYYRGIPYIQVPTTLLAQVDSSIGGKTAVNLEKGKNLFGRFYLPRTTYIDPELLLTLPQRDLQSGFGEIIKYSVLDSSISAKINPEITQDISLLT